MRSAETHAAIARAFDALAEPIPYALFRVDGVGEVRLSRAQFDQAVRDARHCRCGACVCCRAAQYQRENAR